VREEFGRESFAYGERVLAAAHRYGLTDSLTAGLSLQASRERLHVGTSGAALVHRIGIVSAAGAASRDERDRSGSAYSIGYNYQSRRMNGRLLFRAFSPDYATVLGGSIAGDVRHEAAAGVGLGDERWGSLSIDHVRTARLAGPDSRTTNFTYSRILTARSSVFATVSRSVTAGEPAYDVIVQLQLVPYRDGSVSTRFQKTETARALSTVALKNTPVGEGFGGRVVVENVASDAADTQAQELFGQYNATYAVSSIEHRRFEHDHTTELSTAGAVAYVGAAVEFSRPVTDAFALVTLDELAGVRVYHNNQEIGQTNAKGRLLIPNLSSYYDNQIRIDDRDIPLDRSIDEVTQAIAPSLRSGSSLAFSA
jgi:outer membrane usher protein